ncbi:MAG: adenylate/guanylate cyclase domain-containing protein [Lachnospiraceae bacterium]|nr:adenylate/guanylate cyclase domain-containing protein [Lachnospiraceae bacterium]
MNKKKKFWIKMAAFLAVSLLFCVVAGSGLLYAPDYSVSDALYQHESYADGEIVVIGMDQRAMDELGNMPWPRYIIADVIDYLNSDPDNRPAVIGIDTLYDSESGDPDADEALVEAVADAGNVVLAGVASFDAQLVDDGDVFYMKQKTAVAWDEPFEELAEVAHVGHINAMEDGDAVLRHAIGSVDLTTVPDTDRDTVLSFPRVAYELYCEYHGITPNPMPKDQYYYMPFTAKTGVYYDGVSVVDLYDEEIEPSDFAGKIVLIGPYTYALYDEYRTAIDRAAPMYGVEWMANVIDNFRSGFYPTEASDGFQLVLLFLICFGMLWFFYDRHILKALAAEATAVALWLIICLIAFRCGFILHALWVPLFVTILFVASVAMNYLRAAREKRRVQNTFGHYVDPSIMNTLLEQGPSALELGGKMYNIAVLFVDVRGFTTMSESLDPPTVVEIVNRYLTLTTECIIKNHGVLDKFVGDSTMAFWNAPIAQEDPVYLACCAAMDMVEGSIALGKELQERFGRSVSFGIGVNWGPAVVGNIGAPRRMDYTAIGDTVNTSARLEANAPGGQILISRAVADQLGDRAEYTSLGSTIKLKGKAEGFEILRLDSLKRE